MFILFWLYFNKVTFLWFRHGLLWSVEVTFFVFQRHSFTRVSLVYLSNLNDIPDWFIFFIVMMSILILLFMVYNLCCCATNDKKYNEEGHSRDKNASKYCFRVFLSLVHDISLLGFLWKYYSHLANTDDVTDWFIYIMYGMIGILSILILFSMVLDICCCSSNKEEKEEDASKYYSSEDSDFNIDIISDLP